jgi:hypothetical protein
MQCGSRMLRSTIRLKVSQDAIRARIMVGNALCAIAESESQTGPRNVPLKASSLSSGHSTMSVFFSRNPNHVSASATRELKDFIQHLSDRVTKIEALIKVES